MKNSDMDYMKDTIRAFLSKETPRTQKELELLTGIDRRDVKRIIRALRFDGVQVCSGNAGYWLARNYDEVSRTRQRLWHEVYERLALLSAMNRYPLDGQEVIDGRKHA